MPSATQLRGILGDKDGHSGLLVDQLIQSPEQCAAAGQCNAVVDDVSRQLRRCLFQGTLDTSTIRGQRLGECSGPLWR